MFLCRVGKTALLNRFASKKFFYQYKATIGADFYTRSIEFPDKIVSVQVTSLSSSRYGTQLDRRDIRA